MKKKKKRSHIRFGVTILDTGNERKERERESIARPRLPLTIQDIPDDTTPLGIAGLVKLHVKRLSYRDSLKSGP